MIHAHNVWKSYGKLQVLKGLNLDILDGETLVILGRSGVGKSVLLKQIIGLEAPDEGYVEVEGERITDLNKRVYRAKIKPMGMLFQGAALFDSMDVGDNTAFYLRQHPHAAFSESEIIDRVDAALKMVGLEGTQRKMPSELSGGMRKRAALARLIVYRPQIILYDEPTTGLDPITSMQINELINKTKHELNATSIVVTHDIRSALEVGDRLAFHNDGKIAQIAPKEDFFKIDDPTLHEFFNNAIIDKSSLEKHQLSGGS
ncbi:ABC-type transporter, ATPase subunit [Candidatus Protochlamydia naegleriophila]|uniref:ABC-type transporter, ATPase subunit n=1 Tax=Candidatus Protochlamydia naegleriophila TaxID=389348 RepID=A0A0U5JCH5_9BACT|nr:ATP-binding cassette domain-containing protein [Candidatus Protochlamydia naegleriophila]CUI16500.1 ABC-type transporter, ATPase subunit [Candidatus Protochlamydia naegleriophila]